MTLNEKLILVEALRRISKANNYCRNVADEIWFICEENDIDEAVILKSDESFNRLVESGLIAQYF